MLIVNRTIGARLSPHLGARCAWTTRTKYSVSSAEMVRTGLGRVAPYYELPEV